MAVIQIEYGQFKDGYGYGTTNMVTRKLHFVEIAPYNTTAVCGVGTGGSREFASGHLCPKCAKALEVTSVEDLAVDDDTYSWMQAQRDTETTWVVATVKDNQTEGDQ